MMFLHTLRSPSSPFPIPQTAMYDLVFISWVFLPHLLVSGSSHLEVEKASFQ